MANIKLYILVEGPNDIDILRDFLKYHYAVRQGNKAKTEQRLHSENMDIAIRQLSGWGDINTEDVQEDILGMADQGYKVLVIFDADDDSGKHSYGGVTARSNYLKDIFTDLYHQNNLLNYDIFLFPNNQDDGDLETLLIKAVPSTRSEALQCLHEYRECLQQKMANSDKTVKVPDLKQIVYNLYPSIFGLKKQKQDRWDFDSEAFTPLKVFLSEHLDLGN